MMSRSKKLPIIKEKARNYKRSTWYWRTIRRIYKHYIKSNLNKEDIILPNPKSIINDYDYSDYKFTVKEDKYKRK